MEQFAAYGLEGVTVKNSIHTGLILPPGRTHGEDHGIFVFSNHPRIPISPAINSKA